MERNTRHEMKDVSVIFPCFNRLYYTQFTLPRIIDECRKSKRFRHLYIYDDQSSDGVGEFLDSIPLNACLGSSFTVIRKKIGNSTFQINETYNNSTTPYLLKVDNDTLIPEGCLDRVASLMDEHQKLGFLGIGYWPRSGFPKIEAKIELVEAPHIGGIGIFRRTVFDELGPVRTNKRFFGFTQYQQTAKRRGWRIAWAKGITVMDLDESETYSRLDHYTGHNWGRNILGEVNSVFQPK